MNGSGVISQLKEAEFRLDRVCRQFEQAWRQNRPLTIEHCLTQVAVIERPHLLEELIASEWELRLRRGDDPDAAEYIERFPQHAELVDAICRVLAVEYANSEVRGSNATPQPGEHLGDYKIIREVGRGGMGIVYEARQESLGRQVALKVLPARRFRSERELQRFRREAQAVARLHHSHIVEIYGVGEQDGVHYFAMRYVAGRGLDQVITELRTRLGLAEKDSPESGRVAPSQPVPESPSGVSGGTALRLSPTLSAPLDSIDAETASARYRAVARIGLQVAAALQYAHERGIQHRDVKPSNLLIDRQEVVWLSDFGLAKLDLEVVELTESDDLVGTLKYMPPEALTGKVDQRSDIYSLGLTLYELVTLRPALDGSDRAQLLEQVKDPQVTPPRWLVPDVPRDLETIILKAMARDLDQRYQCASDLAADLARFLNREPIRARPQSTFTKFRRWTERKPLLAFLALGTLSMTSTSLYSFGALYVNALATAKQARQDRDLANQMLQIAEQAKTSSELSRKAAEVSAREAQNRLIQAQRAEAAVYLQQGDHFAALAWTAETLRSQQRLATPLQEPGTTGPVAIPVAGSRVPNTQLDAAGYLTLEPALRLRVGAIMDESPRIVLREWLPNWAAKSIDPQRRSGNLQADFQVAHDGIWFTPGSMSLADKNSPPLLNVSDPDRTRLVRWNLTNGQREIFLAEGPAGDSVLTQTGTRRVSWSAQRTLLCSPLSGTADGVAKTLANPPNSQDLRLQAAWESPDGRWMLISLRRSDHELVAGIWDLGTGQLVPTGLLPIAARELQAEFSSDSQRLLVKSDRLVQILEVPSCKLLLPDERFEVAASGWSRDGRWFAGQSQGKTCVYRVDGSNGGTPQVIEHTAPNAICFQSNGGWLALRLPRGRVAFYEETNELPSQAFRFQDAVHPHEIDAQGFGYSPDGQWYALGHDDGHVRVWNIHNHQPWTGILRHPGPVRSLCWSPSGEQLVTCTQNGLLTVWDLSPRATGQMFFHPDAVRLQSVRFSPDGSRIAAAGERGAPVVWDVATGQLAWPPQVVGATATDHNAGQLPTDAAERLQRVDWSRDGARLVAVSTSRTTANEQAGADLSVEVWDAQSGSRVPFGADVQSLHPQFTVEKLRPWLTTENQLLIPDAGGAALLANIARIPIRRLEISEESYPLLMQLAPDTTAVAVVDSAGMIGLYRSSDGMQLQRWQVRSGKSVAALTFNAQGSVLAIGGDAGLQAWETATGKLLTPSFHANLVAVSQLCFSPDGLHLATVSENHVCQILNTATWTRHGGGFQLESRPVLAEFNPRDNTFVTATEAGLIQNWDWSRGEPLTPPLRHPVQLTDADLSADGRRIVVVGGDGLRMWELPAPSKLAPEEIATWARDVALTDVNTADGTLVPLLPNQFPGGYFQSASANARSATEERDSRCRWHLQQAQMARLLLDRTAETFHLRLLRELHPGHPEFQP